MRAAASVASASGRDRAHQLRAGLPAFAPGDAVTFEGATIGAVLDAGASSAGDHVGVALLDRPYAHSGIDRYRVRGERVRTASPPLVKNLSLAVNPQRHAYATRHEIPFSP